MTSARRGWERTERLQTPAIESRHDRAALRLRAYRARDRFRLPSYSARGFQAIALLPLALLVSVLLAVPGCRQRDPIAELESRHARVEKDESGRVVSVDFSGRPVDEGAIRLLGQFQHLKSLNLSLCGTSDEVLAHLHDRGGLEELDLTDNPITDASLKTLAGFGELHTLNLAGTRITDAGLVHLKVLPSLNSLNLSRTKIADAGLEQLGSLEKLEKLDLSATYLTDNGLSHLRGLKNLKEINLSSTNVTDRGLRHLRKLSGLTALYLADSYLTDAGLVHLMPLESLMVLDLDNTVVTEAGTSRLQAALPRCRIDWHNEAAIQALFRAAREKDIRARRDLLTTFTSRTRAGVPLLVEALEDEDPRVRIVAAVALEKIGAEAKPAIPALTDALDDEDEFVQKAARAAIDTIQSEIAEKVTHP